VARVRGITHFYLPPTRLSTNGINHTAFSPKVHQMAPPERGCAHPITADYSFVDLESMKGWVGLVGWPCSGRFTRISGHHPSAAGRAQDKESSPVTDRRSTTVLPSLNFMCAILAVVAGFSSNNSSTTVPRNQLSSWNNSLKYYNRSI